MTAKVVWLSRQPTRAQPLADELAAYGIRSFIYPALHLQTQGYEKNIAKYIQTRDDFDLHIFTGANAADCIAAHHPANFNNTKKYAALVMGESTAAALPDVYQLAADVDAVSSSDALLTLPALATPCRVAVIGGISDSAPRPAQPLMDALAQKNFEVTAVVCYHRSPAAPDAALTAAANNNEVTAAVAYSGESVAAMLSMLGDRADWLRHRPLFVIHPNIRRAAAAAGFKHITVAQPKAMAKTIAAALAKH